MSQGAIRFKCPVCGYGAAVPVEGAGDPMKLLSLYPPRKLGLDMCEAQTYAINEQKRLLKQRRKKEKRKKKR